METTSRVKNSTRNMIFACIAYFIQIILGFLTRRYFIYVFNEEYLGLNSLFNNVLSILSLAELGFGTALVFEMYKPMAEGNKEKVRQLLHFYKTSYMIIGTVVGVLGLCVLPFMNYFQSKAPNVDVNLYVIYILFLANSVVSYFFAYRRSLLYTSQRNDIESKVGMVSNILMSVVQLLILLLLKNYYLYLLVVIIFSLISNSVIYVITQKKYPEYVKKPTAHLDKETKKSINKNIFALIFHRIGSVIVYSTDSLIIYLLLDSATLGKYSNYLLITTYLTTFLSLFLGALRGSVGNSIAKESLETNNKLLNKLNFMFFWIVSFCTICVYVLADPFIDVVLTKGNNSLTLDTAVLMLLCLNFFIANSRNLIGLFKDCAGLFYPDRFKPIIESIINLIVSIALVKLIGLPGVIIGTIISSIATSLWIEPYVLNKYYMKRSTVKYFGKYAIFTCAMLISGAVTALVASLVTIESILGLVIKFAICAIVPNVVLLACLFWMPEFRECLNWGREIIKNFLNKKKNNLQTATIAQDNANVVVASVDLDKDGIVDVEAVVPTQNIENKNN